MSKKPLGLRHPLMSSRGESAMINLFVTLTKTTSPTQTKFFLFVHDHQMY